MTLSDAAAVRVSVRRYLPAPICPNKKDRLLRSVSSVNQRSGLHIQLLCDDEGLTLSLAKSYGMISGARHCFLLAGPSADPQLHEKCGYFGEELVLRATAMGLSTCWIGGTYQRAAYRKRLNKGDELVGIIAVGDAYEQPNARERLIRRLVHRGGTTPQKAKALSEGAPGWFISGLAAVDMAPSAMNQRGYTFSLLPDGTVCARVTSESRYRMVDLGIAKYHFELGAHGGSWSWGDGGIFHKAAEEKSCGAVLWRSKGGQRQYLLIQHKNGKHWSFPKGHMEAEETESETALREIREETGLTAVLDTGFHSVVTYYPKAGVVKDVVFFIGRPAGGSEQAQASEIFRLMWCTYEEALPLVTFADDADVLSGAEAYLADAPKPPSET